MADVVNRDTLEALLARTIAKDLRGELSKLMNLLGDPPNIYNVPITFWENGGSALRGSIEPILRDIFLQQAETQLQETSIGVDWALINENAITWSSEYTYELVRGITDTSRMILQRSINSYYSNPTTIGDLQRSLSGIFSPMRAEMIAVTEVTRAAAEGEQRVVDQIIADNPGMESIDIWLTNRDDITCPICAPRHQQPRGSNWTENPPAHPRCRCWLRHDFRRKQTVDEQVMQVQQYTPAKTVKEAEEWAKTNGARFVSYRGFSVEMANEMNSAISLLPPEQRPLFVGDFAYVQKISNRKFNKYENRNYGVNIKIDSFSIGRLYNELGLTFEEANKLPNSHIVGINTRIYKTTDAITQAKLLTQQKYVAKTGNNYFFNTDGKLTPVHEIGHVYYNNNQLSSKWSAISTKWKTSTNYDLLKSDSEAFAEAFAAYKSGYSDRLPDYVIEFLDNEVR